MQWEVLLVLLIPLAVWILSTIFRSAEEERQKERLRRPEEEGGRVRVPRRPVDDLERVLQEARRRRETESRQPAPARLPETRPVRPAEPAPEARPAAPPPRERVPAPPRAEVPRPAPPPPPREAVVAVRVSEPSAPAPPPVEVAGVAVVQSPTRPPSPFLVQLAGLLRDRKSLAAAVVLKEIFDRPVSQRGEGQGR